jgi:2-methylisocitrate lyase-like PEP mutase family enzyme
MQEGQLLMTQADRDRLVTLKKTKKKLITQREAAGVRRISLATSLYRAAMTGFLDAAREVAELGEFGFLNRSVVTAELNELMRI